MTLFSNAVDVAGAELLKLRANRERLEGKTIVLEQELAELRAVTGDQILDRLLSDDETTAQAGTRLSIVETALADIRKGHAALIVRIQSAIIGLGKAKADELRAKSKKLRARLDRLSADRVKILESLRELEGGGEGWLQDYWTRRGFLPIGMGGGLGPAAAPSFEKLEKEIRQLESEAAAIERQAEQHAAGGSFSFENMEQLAALCGDPEQLAPTHRAMQAWFEDVSPAAARDWATSPWGAPIAGEPEPLPARTRFQIVWQNGVLNEAESGYVHQENRRPTHRDQPVHAVRADAYASAAVVARGY